tara:strand:+ start:3022 stop:3507 length:486 start_codon:yes stop_codon:yes gene_type:complete
MYGRAIMYKICIVLFVVFNMACALANSLGSLVVFRFLAGIMASCPVTLGTGTIADLMPVEKRAGAMGGYMLGAIFGPSIGPIAGGYITPLRGGAGRSGCWRSCLESWRSLYCFSPRKRIHTSFSSGRRSGCAKRLETRTFVQLWTLVERREICSHSPSSVR